MNPPDLRKLAGLIGKRLGLAPESIARLESCPEHSLGLVALRITLFEMKRARVISPSDEDAMIARATPPMDAVAAFTADTGAKKTVLAPWEVIVADVDRAIASPAKRVQLPRWFIDDYWPMLCRKLAQGGRASEREEAIVRRVCGDIE